MIGSHRRTARRLGLLAGVAALGLVLGDVGFTTTRLTLPVGSERVAVGAVRFEGGLVRAAFAQGADITLEDVTIDAGPAEISIPSLTVSGSDLGREQLLAILQGKGDRPLHESLAELNATSVTAPEVIVTQSRGDVGITITHRDVRAEPVEGGVIGLFEVPVTEIEITSPENETLTGEMGALAIEDLDVAHNARFLTQTAEDGADNPRRQLYGAYSIDGIVLESNDGATIEIGAISGDGSEARLLNESFGQMFAFFATLDEETDPTPEETKRIFAILADLYGSVRVGGAVIEGIDVYAPGGADEPAFSIAHLEFGPNGESSLVEGIRIVGDEFDGAIERIETSGFDVERVIVAMQAIADAETNGEEVDPALAMAMFQPMGSMTVTGFSGEAIVEGEPVPVSLGSFSVAADEAIDGATGGVRIALANFAIDIPQDATDDFSVMMRQIGYEALDLSGTVAIGWNGEERTVIVDELSVAGGEMGSVAFTARLGGIGPEIFSTDPLAQQMALFQSDLRALSLSIVDEGLAERALAFAAQMQGVSPENLRTQVAGAAGGMLPMMLGGTPQSFALGEAVSTFVNTPGTLDITVTAKNPAGVPMIELATAANNPQAALALFDIEATALPR